MNPQRDTSAGDHGIDLLFMLRAVRRAMQATRIVQGSAQLDRLAKDDRSPVTVADWASQAVVAIELAPILGATPLVGEEDASALRRPESAPLLAQVVDAVARALGRPVKRQECIDAIDAGRAEPNPKAFFTLDPVDGTKGFLRRQQYAISLALIEAGSPTYGVVGCPNLPADGADFDQADPIGCLAFAIKDGGAWLERDHGEPRQLHIRDWHPGMPVRSCESVEAAHSKQDLAADMLAAIGGAGTPARLDSQAKYVVVARGGADAYLRLPVKADYREKIWDHAAGALVAAEAGCKVVDAEGFPLDFGRGRELTANKGVLAGHPAVVDRLVAAYAKLKQRT
jgi:HAL2 family 3'(2'),5'-bisphosphate nucleotidase